MAAQASAYDAIIVTAWRGEVKPLADDPDEAAVAGLVNAWRTVDRPVIVIHDTPDLGTASIECVIAHEDSAISTCAQPMSTALSPPDVFLEAAERFGAPAVDLTDVYCPERICAPVIGGVLTTRDGAHLTATFAVSLAPALGARLAGLLDSP